jgi:hypothetical protein
MSGIGPGCVKTLRGISAPGILRFVVVLRAKNPKIRSPLAIRTKSDFVFAQPRPVADARVADTSVRNRFKFRRQ